MKPIQNILVSPDATIKETIATINKGGMEIALVVDDDKRLLGVVTDGNIRRAILKNISLDSRIDAIMNKTPVTVKGDQADQAFKLMRDRAVKQVPVVDEQSRVVNIVLIENLLKREKRGNAVVIMAGGRGQRLNPLTNHIPKPLLMVGKKPVLEVIIDQLTLYGFSNIYISLNHRADDIEGYFHDGKYFEADIKYIYEKKRLGTAGALSLIEKTNGFPLLVINADILTRVNFISLCEYHKKQQNDLTVCVSKRDFQVPYGVVRIDNNSKIVSLEEKPVKQYFINAGIYVVNPEVLSMIPNDTCFDMTELINLLLSANKTLGSFPIMEYWLDIGQIFDYQKAIHDYLEVFDTKELGKDKSDGCRHKKSSESE